MKNIIITGLKLLLICGVAAITLGLINEIAEPIIQERKKTEEKQALKELFPDAVAEQKIMVKDKKPIDAYYKIFENNTHCGYVLVMLGSGYGGDMKIMACYTPDGKIISVILLDNLETPGIGKKAEKSAYMDKFIGKGADQPIPIIKGMLPQKEVDAITGATITFMGIAEALNKGAKFIKSLEGQIK